MARKVLVLDEQFLQQLSVDHASTQERLDKAIEKAKQKRDEKEDE